MNYEVIGSALVVLSRHAALDAILQDTMGYCSSLDNAVLTSKLLELHGPL